MLVSRYYTFTHIICNRTRTKLKHIVSSIKIHLHFNTPWYCTSASHFILLHHFETLKQSHVNRQRFASRNSTPSPTTPSGTISSIRELHYNPAMVRTPHVIKAKASTSLLTLILTWMHIQNLVLLFRESYRNKIRATYHQTLSTHLGPLSDSRTQSNYIIISVSLSQLTYLSPPYHQSLFF